MKDYADKLVLILAKHYGVNPVNGLLERLPREIYTRELKELNEQVRHLKYLKAVRVVRMIHTRYQLANLRTSVRVWMCCVITIHPITDNTWITTLPA